MAHTETSIRHADTPLLQEFPPLLRNRNFILLWIGYVVSALADRVHWLVMLTLLCSVVLGMKGLGSQQTAQLNLAMFLPFLVLAPLGGLISDRLPRRRVMIACDLLRLVIVLIARTVLLRGAQSHTLTVGVLLWLVFGSEIILSSVGEIFYVARAAILPNLVHPRQLLQANALISAAGTIFSLIGFVLGDLLIKWRLDYAMYVDGAAFLLSAVCMIAMRLKAGADVSQSAGSSAGLISDAKIGVGYLRNHTRPFQVIGLEVIFFAISAVVFNALPGLLTDKFGLPQSDFGIFMGMAGVGMVAGAAAISRARRGIPKEIGIAWATVLVGGGLLAAAFCAHWQSMLACLVTGSFFAAIMFISVDTLLQRVVPDYVRGRVMAVRDMLTTSGLILMTIPIAIWPNASAYTHVLLLSVAAVTLLLGMGLVAIYFKRQPLPLNSAVARRIVGAYLIVWHRWRMLGACRIPRHGPVLIVGNQDGHMDALSLSISSRQRLIHFPVADSYFANPLASGLLHALGCVPQTHNGSSFRCMRRIVHLLRAGQIVAIAGPTAACTEAQRLAIARRLARIAMLGKAVIAPVYLGEPRPSLRARAKLLRRRSLIVRFGRPFHPDYRQDTHHGTDAMQPLTEQICAALLAVQQRETQAQAGENPRTGLVTPAAPPADTQ